MLGIALNVMEKVMLDAMNAMARDTKCVGIVMVLGVRHVHIVRAMEGMNVLHVMEEENKFVIVVQAEVKIMMATDVLGASGLDIRIVLRALDVDMMTVLRALGKDIKIALHVMVWDMKNVIIVTGMGMWNVIIVTDMVK